MLRLGLDLGTNSIGWALYRLGDDGEPVELVDGGVSIHSDGREPKSQASNAATRRSKRGPRRNRDRLLLRQRRVAHLLDGLDLLPDNEAAREELRRTDPLRLRQEALHRALTPLELGRVLLFFAGRRGFKSNRRTDGGEDGKIRKDVGELRQRMAEEGAPTLGAYLWQRHKRGETIRARLGNGLYPDRQMVEDELAAIRRAQVPHHPKIADKDWNEVIETLLHQRKLHPTKSGVCTLIPCERRAYKAYPVFQEFRIWQEVLNLEVARPGQGFKRLELEQARRVVDELKRCKSRSFDQLFPETRVNFASGKDGFEGDLTASKLRHYKLFGNQWDRLTLERQQEIVERLLETEDHSELVQWLRDEFGLDDEHAAAVASARLPAGTTHLSKAAIERLLPHMREGSLYHEAVEKAGLGHHSDLRGGGSLDRLPYYGKVLERDVVGGRKDGRTDVERFGRVANPAVHIMLGQIRQLFNAIVDRYEKPHEVVVELARELKQSRKGRERDLKRNRENKERNELLRQQAAKAGLDNPSPGEMRKLRLWDEQRPRGSTHGDRRDPATDDDQQRPQDPQSPPVCPFTGETLSIERVLSEETEIDHILPFKRSWDDSMANKVICMRSANREKGRQTPFEAWGHDRKRYDQILARVAEWPRDSNKRWRFDEDAMKRLKEGDDFLGRHLTETRYLSRATRDYLQSAVQPNRVWVTPGRLTAMLRTAWNLNSLLSDAEKKERNDHRHHLIDAVVVGLTSRSRLKSVADRVRASEDLGDRVAKGGEIRAEALQKAIEDPWPEFRADVRGLVERVVVRHRPDHFTVLADKQKRRRGGKDVTSGALHDETAYGIVTKPDAKGMTTLVETKPLESLNPSALAPALQPGRSPIVRDHALRQRLHDLWQRFADGERWQDFAKAAQQELNVRRVRVLTTWGEDGLAFIRDDRGRCFKAYKTGGNAFMDIWLLPTGRTKGETVSRFRAHQPDFDSKIKHECPTAKKLMRLHENDMVAVGSNESRRIYRIRSLSGDRIEAVQHNEGGDLRKRERTGDPAARFKPLRLRAGQVIQRSLRKVSVDITGRVRDAGPFPPSGRRT